MHFGKISVFLATLVFVINLAQAGKLGPVPMLRSRFDDDDHANPTIIALGDAQHTVTGAIPKLKQPIEEEFQRLFKDPPVYLSELQTEVDALMHSSDADKIIAELKKPNVLSKLAIYSLSHDNAIRFLDSILCKLDHCTKGDTQAIHQSIEQQFNTAVVDKIADKISSSWMKPKITDWLQEKKTQLGHIHAEALNRDNILYMRGGAAQTPTSHRLDQPKSEITRSQLKTGLLKFARSFSRKITESAQKFMHYDPNRPDQKR